MITYFIVAALMFYYLGDTKKRMDLKDRFIYAFCWPFLFGVLVVNKIDEEDSE